MDPLQLGRFRTQRAENPEDYGQPLYDRVNYPAAGSASIVMFSQPKGSLATLIVNATGTANTPKSARDTNMDTASVVPMKAYLVSGISLAYIHLTEGVVTNPNDRDKLRGNGWLQFKVGDKEILVAPMVLIPEVNPIMIAATTANNVSIDGQAAGGYGLPYYKFAVPIALMPNQNFSVTLNWPGAACTITNTIDIYCFLHAAMRRPS